MNLLLILWTMGYWPAPTLAPPCRSYGHLTVCGVPGSQTCSNPCRLEYWLPEQFAAPGYTAMTPEGKPIR